STVKILVPETQELLEEIEDQQSICIPETQELLENAQIQVNSSSLSVSLESLCDKVSPIEDPKIDTPNPSKEVQTDKSASKEDTLTFSQMMSNLNNDNDPLLLIEEHEQQEPQQSKEKITDDPKLDSIDFANS